MKKRIAIITNLFPSPWNRLKAAFNRQQFYHLGKIYDIKVFILVPLGEWLRNIPQVFEKNFYKTAVSYIPFIYPPKIFRYLHGFFALLPLLIELLYQHYKKPFCCVFVSWVYPEGLPGLLFSKLIKKPLIVKVHGSDINIFTQTKLRRAQIRWILNRADAVISVSNALKEKIKTLGIDEKKIHVIYNGVDKDIFFPIPKEDAFKKLKITPSKKIILFVGNMIRTKGIYELLDAYLSSPELQQMCELHFIGRGPELTHITQKSEENPSQSGKIICHGGISHKELATWLNAAHIMCLPSYNEGVPNVILESLACGTPVVATNVGGIPEVLNTQCGIITQARSSPLLANALLRSLEKKWDSNQITTISDAYDWNKNTIEIKEIVNSLLL